MLSFSCIVLLGFLLVGSVRDIAEAVPNFDFGPKNPCTVLSERCQRCRCGEQTCTVVEECNFCQYFGGTSSRKIGGGFCSIQRKRDVVKRCCNAECENGATAIVPYFPSFGKRVSQFFPFCHYLFPKCLCAPGFKGRCCEKSSASTCATTLCTECREERQCPKCPLQAKCVEPDPTPTPLGPRCPLKCPPGTTCKLAPPKCPIGKLCPLAINSLAYQCVPVDSCEKECPVGTVCKKVNRFCIRAPCPPQFQCVRIDFNQCAAVLCPVGSSCRVVGKKAVCDKITLPPPPPNSCPPGPPRGIVTPCVVRCSSNDECGPGRICCSHGCSVVCQTPFYGRKQLIKQTPSTEPDYSGLPTTQPDE
ncbi:spore coat protein SP87-like isoform X5 [Oscarella lobularis]|uniref:spore coat protein SP87-like isoform X5 n=1 Tax=Oscarella lobularis TaxID=121494 RepID=UPI00331348DC